MNALDNLFLTVKNLNSKDFLKYGYIAICVILLFTGLIIYRHFSKINSLKKEIKKVNLARQETQVILSKDVEVKKQKDIVDEIIKKGKNFKLLQYFDSIVQNLGIQQNIKSKNITISDLENLTAQGYSEIKLNAEISNLNMKKLVELLDEFEKNERIYIKSLEITKESEQAIEVNLIIATIQPKEEITEIAE